MKYLNLLFAFLVAGSLCAQINLEAPDPFQNVVVDSAEISIEKYAEAISDHIDNPIAYASALANANGKIWLFYEKPLPKKSKLKFENCLPANMNAGLESAEWLTGTSITGLNFTTEASVSGAYHIPPDVHGAAGISNIGYVVNSSIDFYSKSGVGTSGYPESLSSFFSPLSPQTGTFDPKIIWDQYENRWVVVTLEKSSSINRSKIFLAVSATSDPAGAWYFQSIDAAQTIGSNDCWFDYPGFAIDEEAIYITGNYFNFSGNSSCGSSQVLIIDKGTSSGLYAGTVLADDDPANSAGAFTFYNPVVESGNGFNLTLQPAHVFGTSPAGLGTYLVGYSGLTSGVNEILQVFSITDPLSSPSFTHFYKSMGDIDDVSGGLGDIPQNGGADIESNDKRVLNAQWLNDALWLCFNMERTSGANAGQVSAYYLKATATGSSSGSFTIAQQGEVDGEDISTGSETWNPAICIDNNDNAAIVFSSSSSSSFASSYVASINGSTGAVGPSTLLSGGSAAYERTFGGGSNRWGDYVGITVDPNDGDIWAFSQSAISQGSPLNGENGRWGVFIEEYSSLALPMDLLSFEAVLNVATVEFTWITVNEYDCQSYEIELLDNGQWETLLRQDCSNSLSKNIYNDQIDLDRFGSYLFRLKQTDYDQSIAYSDLKAIEFMDSNDSNFMEVFPNPFSTELNMNFNTNWAQKATLQLIDSSGKTIYGEKLDLANGRSRKVLDLSNIKAGVYALRLSNDSGVLYSKLIKAE
jgi:hypothetical protein